MAYFKFRGKTVGISSLHSSPYNAVPESHLYIGGGVYKKKGKGHKWTGESWGGDIPYTELIEWAFSKGFVKWKRRDDR